MAVKKKDTSNGIGYSPLTERVFMGRQNRAKSMWIGEKKDITNEFIGVALSYFEENTIRKIGAPGGDVLIIHIKNTRAGLQKLLLNLQERLSKLKK